MIDVQNEAVKFGGWYPETVVVGIKISRELGEIQRTTVKTIFQKTYVGIASCLIRDIDASGKGRRRGFGSWIAGHREDDLS
jgi:hypothetical protein